MTCFPRSVFGVVLACLAGCSALGLFKSDREATVPPTKTGESASSVTHDPTAQTTPVDRLTVNDETVEAGELWKDLHDELAGQANMLSPQGYRSYVARRAAQLITDKIAEMLLYQQASLRLSPEMTTRVDKYVDGDIRKIVTSEHGGVQRRYEKYLESQGRTLEDVHDKLRRRIVVTSYLEAEVRPKMAEPTRAELLAAFEATAESARRPARRSMSLIDVRISKQGRTGTAHQSAGRTDERGGQSPPDAAARAAALSRIQAVQTELLSGAKFADVARRSSDGLHAADGGAWGWVTRGSVRERFEPAVEALYRLSAGEVSDVIEAKDGFFLVRCDGIDPGAEPDFQALQPRLKERHFLAAYDRSITKLVADLREKARIEPANLERFHAALVEAAPDPADARIQSRTSEPSTATP